jgi:hypothetical protein
MSVPRGIPPFRAGGSQGVATATVYEALACRAR